MTDEEMKANLSKHTKGDLVGMLMFAYRTIRTLEATIKELEEANR